MGQYHLTVNLSKREYIDPSCLGDGLKLLEQCGSSPGGTNDALHLLLAVSNGRGGGDAAPNEYIGRWGGDRIAVIGDDAANTDLLSEEPASDIYYRCNRGYEGPQPMFNNITPHIIPVLEDAWNLVYITDSTGFVTRRRLGDLIQNWEYSHGPKAQRVARIAGKNYSCQALRAAIKTLSLGYLDDEIPIAWLRVHPIGQQDVPEDPFSLENL